MTFDRANGTGTVCGGDLGWDNPKSFTLELVDQVLRTTEMMAAQLVRQPDAEAPDLPTIDAALALARLTGLTGKDEIIWLRMLGSLWCLLGTGQGRPWHVSAETAYQWNAMSRLSKRRSAVLSCLAVSSARSSFNPCST